MGHDLTLSIVIPVYGGAKSIGGLVKAIDTLDIAGGHEIILVVDGSPDNSIEICRDLLKTCRAALTVINLSRNFGEHNAVLAGLRKARGAWAVTMDDDCQNPPSEVKRLLNFARRSGQHVVYARYRQKEHPWWRNLGSRFANRVADFLLDKPAGLYLSSFRCIDAFVVSNIVSYDGPYPYIDGLIFQVTHKADSVEVKHLPRSGGASGYTLSRLMRLGLHVLVNFSILPLHVSTLTGLVLSFCGAIGSLLVLLEAVFRGTPPGWSSLMAAILLLAGVQLLMLGLIGEYIGRVYLTVNRRPQAVVETIERNALALAIREDKIC